MTARFSEAALWILIVGMGLITYALRLSLIVLWERVRVPKLVRDALRYVPPAVLSAIIFPELFHPGDQLLMPFVNLRLVAGIVAALVAWRTRNVILTVGAGMAVLWALQALPH